MACSTSPCGAAVAASPASRSSRRKDGLPPRTRRRSSSGTRSTAIHFGIRAFEPHGAPRAHARRPRQDRQRRQHPDPARHVQRRTPGDSSSAVNPLGVQMDGTIVEQGGALAAASASRYAAPRSRPTSAPTSSSSRRADVTDVRLRGRGPHSVQEPRIRRRRAGWGSTSCARCSTPGTKTRGRRRSAPARRSSAQSGASKG